MERIENDHAITASFSYYRAVAGAGITAIAEAAIAGGLLAIDARSLTFKQRLRNVWTSPVAKLSICLSAISLSLAVVAVNVRGGLSCWSPTPIEVNEEGFAELDPSTLAHQSGRPSVRSLKVAITQTNDLEALNQTLRQCPNLESLHLDFDDPDGLVDFQALTLRRGVKLRLTGTFSIQGGWSMDSGI